MSEIPADQKDDSPPVTLNQFERALENISKQMNEALKIRDDTAKHQQEQTEARLNQFAGVLQQIVDKLNSGHTAAASDGKIAEYSNSAQMIAQAVKEIKQAWQGNENTELDTISQLLAQSLTREVINEGKRRVRKSLRAGLLTEDEVEIAGVVLDNKIERGIPHGPGV